MFRRAKVSTIKIVQPTKVTIGNITFDSKTEANRYLVLRNLQDKGLIECLEVQPKFEIFKGFILKDKHLSVLFSNTGKVRKNIQDGTIKFDFSYIEKGNPRIVIEDTKFKGWQKAKNKKTAIKSDWKLKVRIWLAIYQDEYELRII